MEGKNPSSKSSPGAGLTHEAAHLGVGDQERPGQNLPPLDRLRAVRQAEEAGSGHQQENQPLQERSSLGTWAGPRLG